MIWVLTTNPLLSFFEKQPILPAGTKGGRVGRSIIDKILQSVIITVSKNNTVAIVS